MYEVPSKVTVSIKRCYSGFNKRRELFRGRKNVIIEMIYAPQPYSTGGMFWSESLIYLYSFLYFHVHYRACINIIIISKPQLPHRKPRITCKHFINHILITLAFVAIHCSLFADYIWPDSVRWSESIYFHNMSCGANTPVPINLNLSPGSVCLIFWMYSLLEMLCWLSALVFPHVIQEH